MSGAEQVVIHAGLPKTGSTYLQECFVANRSWLARRGVWYPEVGQESLSGHHNLTRRLRGLPTRDVDYGDTTSEDLLRLVLETDRPRVLLSSEGFSELGPSEAAVLRQALAGREVRVVLFLRRRSRMCVSAWQESVKHGSAAGFLEFVAEQLLGSSAWVLRPEHVLEPIHAMFGESAMRVVIYDHLVEDGIDLFDFFVSSILGLADDAPAGLPRAANKAIDPAVLEVVRAVNQVRLARGGRSGIADLRPLLTFLQRERDGQELVKRVAAAIERHGEDFDLRPLDGEWLDQDRRVRAALRTRVLNAADDRVLFRRQDLATVRILRPSWLYASIGRSVFEHVVERLDRVQ